MDNKLESYPFKCNIMHLAKNGWVWSGGSRSIRVYHDKEWHEVDLALAHNLGFVYEVQALSETSDGLIWVSSSLLSVYNPLTGQASVVIPTIPVPTPTSAPKSDTIDIVTSPSNGDMGPVFEAADGALWYNQQFDGIVRWDRATGQKQLWSPNDGFQGRTPIPTKFIQTQDGDIWMGLLHRGVYRWHNGMWQTWLLPSEDGSCFGAPLNEKEVVTSARRLDPQRRFWRCRGQGDFTVIDMLEDRQGWVWVAFNNGGVTMWDGSEWNMIGDFETPATPMVLYEDSAGTMWIGSLQHGVGKYHDGTLTMFPKLNIVTFVETPDHRLFGGGSEGLFLYNRASDQWEKYPPGQ